VSAAPPTAGAPAADDTAADGAAGAQAGPSGASVDESDAEFDESDADLGANLQLELCADADEFLIL
jgi:hypothetical protein